MSNPAHRAASSHTTRRAFLAMTLSQIAAIKGVLEIGMTATDRSRIEFLLAGN